MSSDSALRVLDPLGSEWFLMISLTPKRGRVTLRPLRQRGTGGPRRGEMEYRHFTLPSGTKARPGTGVAGGNTGWAGRLQVGAGSTPTSCSPFAPRPHQSPSTACQSAGTSLKELSVQGKQNICHLSWPAGLELRGREEIARFLAWERDRVAAYHLWLQMWPPTVTVYAVQWCRPRTWPQHMSPRHRVRVPRPAFETQGSMA